MRIRKWSMPEIDQEQVDRLMGEGGFPQAVAQVLVGRGYAKQEQAETFGAERAPLCNPFLMKDMDKAVQRLLAAIEEGELIAIYGDYDCDGITATAMLYSYLQDLGARVMYYIPDRDSEGYGMNVQAVEKLKSQDVRLIVTVDNGISAIEEVRRAQEIGIDVVITDHHQPRETLPQAVAVVNPHREDCTYPFSALCGVGVAFKLICAMEGDETCEEMLLHYGNLVAIGTVGDVVVLTGENRTIVKSGLESISNCENLGLNALIEIGGFSGQIIDAERLAFGLVPRINAAGRMGKAGRAVELLLCEDEEDAASLAEEINGFNVRRKELVLDILKQIDQKIEEDQTLVEQRLIVLSGEGWHHGVVGIAAAKLVEQYGKPCILISAEGEEARGSARSVEGYSIIDAINRCRHHLTQYGGHNQAAGISIKTADIPAWIQELEEDAFQQFDLMPVETLRIDAILSPSGLNLETVAELKQLEPFGCGNEQPNIALLGCKIEGVIPMSGDKHIRLQLSQNGKSFQVVYFGMSSKAFPYKKKELVDLAVNLDTNEYNGESRLSIKVRDIRPNDLKQDKMVVGRQYYEKYKRNETLEPKIRHYIQPEREDIAKVYRLLRQQGGWVDGYDLLWCRLGALNYCKMMLCLDIMAELGLTILEQDGQKPIIRLPAVAGKVDLEESLILKRLKAGEKKW